MRLAVGGIERQRAPVALFRLVALASLSEGIAQIAQRLRPVRPQSHRPTKAVDRRVGAIEQVQRPAAIAPGFRIRGPCVHRAIVGGDGVGELSLPLQGVAEIVQRLGIEGSRASAWRKRLGLRRLSRASSTAQRVVVRGVSAVRRDRLLDQRSGARMIARLMGDEPREMQPVRLARLDLQHLAIKAGGFIEAALLVVANAFGEQQGDVAALWAGDDAAPDGGRVVRRLRLGAPRRGRPSHARPHPPNLRALLPEQRIVGYQGLSSRSSSHRHSGTYGSSSQTGLPSAPAKVPRRCPPRRPDRGFR